jgi:SpoVK/Ycf46/Vps4 family AAA+-type ATPase
MYAAPERGVWVFDPDCGCSPGFMTLNRTFFITTNDIAGLDPALTRPGRLGYHLEFHSATSSQMHSMLAAHYPEYGPERLKGITDNIEPGTTVRRYSLSFTRV